MPRHHSPQQKAAALDILAASGYDIAHTSQITGIPQRTLYTWRQQLWQVKRRHTPLSPPPLYPDHNSVGTHDSPPLQSLERGPGGEDKDTPPDDFTILTDLRDHIVAEMRALAADLRRDIHFTSPHQRASMLFQFIDRLQKLDAYLPRTRREQVFRIEYVDPDGSIHDTPFWKRGNDDDDTSSSGPTSPDDQSTSKSGRDVW